MKYENNTVADATVYLPLDTKKNAQQFLNLFIPTWCFFHQYEYWLNYLNELNTQTTYLFNIRIFREQQMFFKWYGGFTEKH
jgi:3-deoxy-D-manno-octulosonic-acid transferase